MCNMIADQATGLRENPHGIGQFYDDQGNLLTREEAQDVFLNGFVEVPNAGAGSYETVLTALGYEEVRVIEWCSSAGDWTFAARDDDSWYIVSQENRYPYHGFRYCRSEIAFDSFEDACSFACEG